MTMQFQSDTESTAESIDFEITLSGTYWGRRYPHYTISVDEAVQSAGHVQSAPSKKGLVTDTYMAPQREQDTYHKVMFSVDLLPGPHVLHIRFDNKQDTDTREFVDGVWQKDVLLNIESIKIDGVDLGHLLFTQGRYLLDQAHNIDGVMVSSLPGCVNLGFNGSFNLPFTCPYYIWLLEHL